MKKDLPWDEFLSEVTFWDNYKLLEQISNQGGFRRGTTVANVVAEENTSQEVMKLSASSRKRSNKTVLLLEVKELKKKIANLESGSGACNSSNSQVCDN